MLQCGQLVVKTCDLDHAPQRVPSVYICILSVNVIKMLLEELQLECPGCGSNFEVEMVVANDSHDRM